jgi:hypothetical protein
MEDFDVRSGWIPVATALLTIVTPVAGDNAWEQIKSAIRRGSLHACCVADRVTKDFERHWLDFVTTFEGVGSEGYRSDDKRFVSVKEKAGTANSTSFRAAGRFASIRPTQGAGSRRWQWRASAGFRGKHRRFGGLPQTEAERDQRRQRHGAVVAEQPLTPAPEGRRLMRYRDRSPYIRLRDLLHHIADVATGGDMEAAWMTSSAPRQMARSPPTGTSRPACITM